MNHRGNRMKHKKRISTLALGALLLSSGIFPVMSNQAFAQDPTAIVARAYEDILGRKVDKAGMRMFRSKIIDNGWTEEQVRDALRNSPEYTKQGADDIIKRAYEDIFNRQPDPAGLKLYREKISKDGWSEKQIRDNMRGSQEYKNAHH